MPSPLIFKKEAMVWGDNRNQDLRENFAEQISEFILEIAGEDIDDDDDDHRKTSSGSKRLSVQNSPRMFHDDYTERINV